MWEECELPDCTFFKPSVNFNDERPESETKTKVQQLPIIFSLQDPPNTLDMGKRKKAAKKPSGAKKSEPLAKIFSCLFCNHEKSVTIKLDRKGGVGDLSCTVCGQSFQCQINYLSAAVDVYSEWVDACDAVAKENAEEARALQLPTRHPLTDRSGTGGLRHDGQDLDGEDIRGGGYEGEGIVGDDEY